MTQTPHAESVRTLDIVLPVYNEAAAIRQFHSQLSAVCQVLDYDIHIVFVDDGSTDGTAELLAELSAREESVSVIELSRNFGHQAALTAGLDFSQAAAVITMDADGQHPPELIPEMVRLMEAGMDLVLTQRVDQRATPWSRRLTSAMFYRVINLVSNTKIQPGGADFRLMRRSVVDAIGAMREYHRFLRGMVSWLGFRTAILPYAPRQRARGQSKYSLRKQLSLARDAAFSFSLVPLYLALVLGFVFLLLALAEAIYVASFWLTGSVDSLAPGWSSLMFMILIVGGTVSIILGIIGIYTGYIFQEVKRRPIYVVRRVISNSDAQIRSAECINAVDRDADTASDGP